MAKLSAVFNDTQFDNSGNLLSGGLIYTYAAGSATPLATYTSSSSAVAQSNPIILNARGEVASPIWLTEGLTYKLRLFDASNNFIREFDNVAGVGDTSVTIDQWIVSGIAPTYVSATQFTLPGDQTSAFQVNRRVKATVTAGTVYGTISVSTFAALTTVTLIMDAGQVLDSGLSAVSYGILTPLNPSIPVLSDAYPRVSGSSDPTKKLRDEIDDFTTGTTRVLTHQDRDGTNALIENQIQAFDATVAANALTLTVNVTSLAFRSATITSGVVNVRKVNPAITLVVPSSATLGTVNGVSSRLAILAIDNAGTVEVAVVNYAGAGQLDESNLISTTAISAASTSASVIYSTTARSNVPYRVIGYIDISEAAAGTWATAPTVKQGMGGNTYKSVPLQSQVRVQTANGYGSTNTVIRRWTTVVSNIGTDITYADSATLGGTFTINTPDFYTMGFTDDFNVGSTMGISLNSNQLTTGVATITAANRLSANTTSANLASGFVGARVYLIPGDVIRAHTQGAPVSATNIGQFTITRG